MAETPQPTPPPAFGLIYEGAIGQLRQKTSLRGLNIPLKSYCNILDITLCLFAGWQAIWA